MADLSHLLELCTYMPAFRRLVSALERQKDVACVVLDSARPYVVAALYEHLGRPLFLITSQPEVARKFQEQLTTFLPASVPVMLFPEPDVLPYERLATDAATGMERVRVLAALLRGSSAGEEAPAPLVVASAAALMSKTVPFADFASACQTVRLGEEREPLKLLGQWLAMGYRMANIVETPGMVSRRGGIVDIWASTEGLPVRLEFFGNTIESIRAFDPTTQRSTEGRDAVFIAPAGELLAPWRMERREREEILRGVDLGNCTADFAALFQHDAAMLLEGELPPEAGFYAALFNTGNILEYLPPAALVVIDEPDMVAGAVVALDTEAEELRAAKLQRGELPRHFPRPYFTWEELSPLLKPKPSLSLVAWGAAEALDFTAAPVYTARLEQFLEKVAELSRERRRVIIVSHQASRLGELLSEKGLAAGPVGQVGEIPEPGACVLETGSLAEGWVMSGETYLFTDAEIFGFVKKRRLFKKRPVPRQKLVIDFVPEDYVVHVEHGIGKFKGVTMLKTGGAAKEYLVLEYAAGDTLYVPTDQIDRVSRYIGIGDRSPVLSRLGTQEWHRTKQRAKDAATQLAQELLALYAAREVLPGFAFSPDTPWQREMEAAFPYVETPDQLRAQREVKDDMERPKPMDRLVLGDVGYGKTEVAIRAAFKAVMDGKQVAVLVPTTVLAQQHFATFSERLEAFPVKVEVLSRFRSEREQRAILAGLADGTIDICIGTHRLLQKDVVFKDLGLLIIDEEQRFGVEHKEHFKRLRREIDVLTLSATPIPRTLHMSLAGVRDMSLIETPPEARLPVKTYVAEYNEHLVREAILRELERNGQVFFVHNRVQSIAMVAQALRALVPEARIAVAHGQMPEDELENVMTDFATGRIDVLVCTTIIESGLDMPNANTLIVNKADKFGLTQFYQLRGRVGRGANLAYAYFLYDKGARLSPVAHQRLRTIYEATELGAGFNIAMKDLEIRGAGTLLGPRQSGHISAIGFSLYTRLLAEAVEEQKAILAGRPKPPPRLPAPSMELPLDAFIPESYVADLDTRLELYRTLADVDEPARLDDIRREYADRFGSPPPEVENLLYAVKLKILSARAGIESIGTEDGHIVLRRFGGLPFNTAVLEPFRRDGVEVGRTQIKVRYGRGEAWQQVLEALVGRIAQDSPRPGS